MKTLESVKNDVFASFADAQMSKEEMTHVIGGKERCKVESVTRKDDGKYIVVALGTNTVYVYDGQFYPEVIGGMIWCY